MKKLFFALLVSTCVSVFSQEKTSSKENESTIGVKLQIGHIQTIGVDVEFNNKLNKNNYHHSMLAYISTNTLDYKKGSNYHIGYGFELGFGSRYYLQKNIENKGLYFERFFTYGKIDFDHTYASYTFPSPSATNDKFVGTYTYWSLFNSNIGYKLKSGNFVFEPALGAQWNWEEKGKGQVDNINIDNLFFRGSLKVAYAF